MRVRRVAKVRQDATHMEHGRELNAKFAPMNESQLRYAAFRKQRPPLCRAEYHPERSVQENHIDPHASLRTLPQSIGRRKRNLVGPQDKLPLTAGLDNGRTKEQIA